jgi:short-subunit dehydrogenase
VFEFAIDIVLLARRSDGLRRAVRPHLERRIVPLLPTSQLCNVRDSELDMTKWRKQRSERSIRLDAGSRHVLVNNAGAGASMSLASATAKRVSDIFAVNVTGPTLLAAQFLARQQTFSTPSARNTPWRTGMQLPNRPEPTNS